VRGIAFSRVCLSVCPRSKRKTAWAIDTKLCTHIILSIEIARHALTHRSKGQRSRSHGYKNRHGHMVDCDKWCYSCVLLLPAWVCMSIRLTTFCIFLYLNYSHFVCDTFRFWMFYACIFLGCCKDQWNQLPGNPCDRNNQMCIETKVKFIGRLWSAHLLPVPSTRTTRYRSFIHHGLLHYQPKLK